MNMKKVIMMFALMTGTISAFAQNADSTSVGSDNTRLCQNVGTTFFYNL